jgi:hypothetical protein|tara:strand:+ start:270 stop:527 length:258 start_codon:yes stop_codon:yes gene_type:complete
VSKEGNMPRYVLEYAGSRDFESEDPKDVIDVFRKIMQYDKDNVDDLLSTCASNVCDKVYKPVRFGNVQEFVEDLLKYKILKELSQ